MKPERSTFRSTDNGMNAVPDNGLKSVLRSGAGPARRFVDHFLVPADDSARMNLRPQEFAERLIEGLDAATLAAGEDIDKTRVVFGISMDAGMAF